ncbi:hypothetical protein I3843_01G213100 [Carya illinoinensis]|nr:hypothetical protein I3843_01G213100 [Carya illinoinensis]
MGCFRPITRKIVDKAVALLRMVPNLRSNNNTLVEAEEDKALNEVASVIEHYNQSGRGLDLHELACLAACRALDLGPFLLGSILSYFKFAPSPFERILMEGKSFEQCGNKVGPFVLHAARISYRLLLMDSEIFSKLWDWSCFLDLVKQSSNLHLSRNAGYADTVIADIRWCGIQILSVILKTSCRPTADFSIETEEAFTCLLRWEEFCQDTSLEKAEWYIEESVENSLSSPSRSSGFSEENCLQSSGICPLAIFSSGFHELPSRSKRLATWADKSFGNLFVLTSAVKKSFEMVVLAVSQKWPVLLYGPAGAGKSALINKLARDSGNRVLCIHMDDQIDAKTLLGSYVCTEQPGEFRWQPGSLTQAVQNGFWVVFEDIDKAPSDVQSILSPLLEGESSFSNGHGEEITVAESSRLFSTISTSKLDISHGAEGGKLGAFWRKVIIMPPSNEDLLDIIKAWYPNLEPISEKLIETFENVNISPVHQLAGFSTRNSASVSYRCRFSLRDLLKWCKRISDLGFSFNGDCLSAYEGLCIYQEAVDIFAAFSTSAENRVTIMKDIAKLWAVPTSVAETLYPQNKPVIQELHTDLRVGRVYLQRTQRVLPYQKKPFAEIRSSVHLLERIACSVKCNEPVLLVGETGTGKTTLVQYLAMKLTQKLTVLNLSQQSDVADLLGGFKPMDARFICFPLYKEFEDLFSKTFSMKVNVDFLAHLQKHLTDKNWKMLLAGFQKGVDSFRNLVQEGRSGSGKKRKKPLDEESFKAWENFSFKLETARGHIGASSGMLFSFVEGAFVTALRNGEWILLDEVNLAPPETLQRVSGVLEGENGSLCLAERGDVNYIHRHPNFRIFACMNPATDAGKRDLPFTLRSRFTEYFVDDVLDDEDLTLFINQFMDDSKNNRELVNKIVRFYKAAKKDSEERLQDGANQKPQYSLRSLYRSLEYTRKAERRFGFQKAIYDGFCMFFLTLLDGPSAEIMNKMILSYLLGGNMPPHVPFDDYLTFKGNSKSDNFLENYVLTKSVREHLRNLARAILIKRYPVLLQGPTSSGKTSLIQYLAAVTGHAFVRINNHEHTDLQEYLGSYVTDASGKLEFHEGVLVKAVRNGYWIVLDELNLAPTEVLEALNRLLDDNRELFVPELQETIRAHPDFMLFATQNPPTFYGGRKILSRAFRNRFIELHVDEIPENELSEILEKRCVVPESYSKKIVGVMKELQLLRQSSKIFAGKHGFITPRDLLRWANRFRAFGTSYEDLAKDGYYLLAERLRDEDEKLVVQEVLERQLRAKLVKDDLYKQDGVGGNPSFNPCDGAGVSGSLINVVWTKSMWRLYFLVKRCYELREPVLLVGETGGGKTTVCQLLSIALDLKLHILNCHQYTETSDFLGGFYPIRGRSRLIAKFKEKIEQVMMSEAFIHYPQDFTISSDISQASSTLDHLSNMITHYKQGLVSCVNITKQDVGILEKLITELSELHQKWQTIFMWQDGSLVQAMKHGDLFLVDEISLADDSVLERLNSVLEPERKLSLAEKGGSVLEKITAHPKFFVLATMNPGGDYGKKELSPALRNRFTEIWVPSVGELNELRSIALQRISNPKNSHIVDAMLSFWEWFNQLQPGRMLTVRDLLSWVAFINTTERILGPEYAFLHGAFLVLLDGLSLGSGISKRDAGELRERCLSFLLEKLQVETANSMHTNLSRLENYGWGHLAMTADISCSASMHCDNIFGIDPFYIEKGCERCEVGGFEFLAPTTCRNAYRVLRAMQLPKPVLLEGSPGVGKTSLIVALGKFSGHKVVRINLSEQTDIMDLLGSDLPIDREEGIQFAWSDGILLQALKEGCWVLLDELNLAPQSVLEGLNAILDHRAEVFIPELGLTFKCPSSFRLFACQNPSYQGGGRKGLPKSFLNRFTKVYVDELVEDDHLFICSSLYPSIPRSMLSKLILFNKRLHEDTMLYHKFAQDGSPWEFNLRDVIRSCQIIQGTPENLRDYCFLNILYIQRMRTAADRREILRLYEEVFEVKPFINPFPRVQLNSRYLIVGKTAIKRNYVQSSKMPSSQLKIIPGIRQCLEAAAHCVQHQWLCILMGPPSSGKSSLIRLLAQLTGSVLNELNLSAATDISELLGCFEQYDAFRNFRIVADQVECYVNEYYSLQLDSSKETFMGKRKDLLITRWIAFLSSKDYDFVSGSTSLYVEKWKRMVDSLGMLVEIIEQLKLDHKRNVLPVSWSSMDLDRAMKMVLKLQDSNQKRPISAKFEWVMGPLIKAIEHGEWIVLENANLCNPTVLDRINSLVEPSGSIMINECGIVDGKPVVLHPHPNFRMFLTVNPNYGEVSRAMRNRGVEIFMMQPYWLLDVGSGYSSKQIELKDVERFLILSGIPGGRLVESMAKAHIYARDEGSRLNISITYLELARWVQLLQQLLMNGNQPLWSLHVSWEHTYISSLCEAGGNIISQAKHDYLQVIELSDSSLAHSLCLPGGWPMPLKIRDFIWYSKEACVKQNCMYLEFLGTRCVSYEIARIGYPVDKTSTACGHARTHFLNVKKLEQKIFPRASTGAVSNFGRTELDLALANKMLLFAANWTIEQATESDIELYILWFSWFSSRLQPFCQCFSSFSTLIKQAMEHPIWNYVTRRRHEVASLYQVDFDMQPIPILSFELVDLAASSDMSKLCSKYLSNAINCLGPLRVSYQQWNAESCQDYSEAQCFKPVLKSPQLMEQDEAWSFIPILKSLRVMEEDILHKFVDPPFMFVESPSFDVLIRLYTDLLEDHIQFWNGVMSSNVEQLLISWWSLLKDAAKLKEKLNDICPEAIDIVLRESKNLENMAKVSSWSFHSEKSLLWVHGGHPYLPPSSNLYHKQHQLSLLCELLWPTKSKSWEQVNRSLIETVASSNPELRFLAMQGVSMSLYIMNTFDHDQDEVPIVQQLEEMRQMIQKIFESKRQKLEESSYKHTSFESDSSACCSFFLEVLCGKSGFESWQDTLPLTDRTSFLLDLELLQELSSILLVDPKGLQRALGTVSNLLEYGLKFSLTFSSRPPQIFLPHQKILWILDAWTSVDAVNAKITSFVLEMWFRWHESLWTHRPDFIKNFSKIGDYDIPLPDMLFQPVNTATVIQILQRTSTVCEYFVHGLKLRVASCSLWCSSPTEANIAHFLLSMARFLFQQIIYAHEKSFDANGFVTIKSNLCAFRKNMDKEENIQQMCFLILSSSYCRLKESVCIFIEPLLRELYLPCSSTDFLYVLGCAWLRIGGLRFHLLLSGDDLDPAMKYQWKYSHLAEKKASIKLEMQVRQECDYLAGCFSSRQDDNRRVQALENLEVELRRVRRKIVFRSDPGKFKKLKTECGDFLTQCFEFLKLVTSLEVMASNIKAMDLPQIVSQVSNWQDTATCFINRLSDEYAAYIDVVQPVQVAVYEMKLGSSLVLSSVFQKSFLSRVELDNVDLVMGTIYSLMRFPRGSSSKSVSVNLNTMQPELPFYDIDIPTKFCAADMSLLEKLVSFSSDIAVDKVSVMQLQAALHHHILVRVAHSVANSQLMDNESFKILDKIFSEFSNLWMRMKVQSKTKRDYGSQLYKFRPRAFHIDSIIEVDISTLGKSMANESFLEWKELLSEEEFNTTNEAHKEPETSEEEWNVIEESFLNNMVHVHNQLFGSNNLVLAPGTFEVSDADRLLSFTDSYRLGVGMIKGLGSLFLSSLDAKLVPEHLLRLCLEHDDKTSRTSGDRYNFYKDSNAPLMAKMVKLLTGLQHQIISLLNEWEDHHGLGKILDVIEMLLNIPLSTPLAKALAGLQFLLNRAQVLQENGSKLSLSDQLEPIHLLVSSWKKMEFGSWPALLDEVQDQYEINAGKLWFPLYSVIQHRHSPDMVGYNLSTIQSLEEFIHTSSIGEFKKRLQILFAVLGQFSTGRCLNMYPSPSDMETLKILYNVVGFYVQFLPTVLEHIKANRRSIEVELKELLKLCGWEHSESLVSIENSKRTRHKLKKLIQKYTDFLQQPVMLFLNQDALQSGEKAQFLHGQLLLNEISVKTIGIPNASFDMTLFHDEDRSIWFADWRKKIDYALQKLHLEKAEYDNQFLHFRGAEEVTSILRQCSASQSAPLLYQDQWKAVWWTIEKIYRTVVHCGDLWKDTNKSLGKRRAFSELLKLLESSGLSRHKSMFMEDQHKSWWFLEPSYDIQHLLLTQNRLASEASDVAAASQSQSFPCEFLVTEWKTGNEYYFKSIASVLLVQQICLNSHKDITREQVDRSGAFLNQLIDIQQKQQIAANDFAKQLKRIRECISNLENLYKKAPSTDTKIFGVCSVQNQHATMKCLWQQKQLFDDLCVVMYEESLLLKTFANTHLNTCQSVKAAANRILDFIGKFLPDFQKSKELLDYYLLGRNGAITTFAGSSHCCVITRQMEQLVSENFQAIKEFEKLLSVFREQDVDRSSVKEALLSHFEELFKKGRLIEEEYTSMLSADAHTEGNCFEFGEALNSTFEQITNVLQKIGSSSSDRSLPEESVGNITSWKFLFESFVADLRLDLLCDKLLETIFCEEILVNHSGNNISSKFHVGVRVQHLHVLLNLILNFGDALLQDLLAMYRTVSVVTHVLANVLASLYSKGFGISAKDELDDTTHNMSQDASGTGMGEGAGMNDVSDQITDEDQLLGALEKPSEEQDASNEIPNKNEKGIEMEQDFAADTCSISGDSAEENNENSEDEQIESTMGETGASSEVVDEKLWNKDEDDKPSDTNEKYESGSSVKDQDTSCRELRAKEDYAATSDEPGELNSDELDKHDDEIRSEDNLIDRENTEDVNLDKEEAFADPTGLKLDESNQCSDDNMDTDEKDSADPLGNEEFDEKGDPEQENTCPADETNGETETETEQVGGSPKKDDLERDHKENVEMNSTEPSNNVFEPGISDFPTDRMPNAESATQPKGDSHASDSRNIAPESNWSSGDDAYNDLAPLRGLPSINTTEMDFAMADSSNTGRFTDDPSKSQLPQHESSSAQKTQPNPYRSVGDALEEWKERVKVSVDLQADNLEAQVEMEDDNAEEYGYVSEFEKGTAQALGPAISEQVDRNVDGNKPEGDCPTVHRDDITDMEIENQNSEAHPLRSHASIHTKKIEEHMHLSGLAKSPDEGSEELQSHDDGNTSSLSESLVSVKKAFLEGIQQFTKLSVIDDELGKAQDPREVSNDMKDNATALWRRYELLTTRLSQELAEQLRLVMEPTLASKLQGDYKTGKRINMKKVIPYIASHYRKDKIWLRRTRPNKRDYQVVIAVDDSRSMSESCCGDVAIEALVTVCRAMSHLEMGNLAVASFGKKGNITLLHDFDQPFSGEAGIKMISSLTFKQENTIADEPVVDLLQYLNNMLDVAVANARLPSGQNPLQQLVLIIADGRFHEKENLKRCVRDALSRKRMVAFLLLDSPQESIMDLMEASFEGGAVKFSKYMDSFPFPYYIVLRNIKALPRTLSDLLRQWFELMPYWRD